MGGGPRLCIGNGFAKMETALLLATLARRFKPEPILGRPPVPQPSITLRPKDRIRTKLHERRPLGEEP